MTARIITIAQQKGGSGKTTLAANLAVALAVNDRQVAILDTDPQGSLGRWYINRVERFGEIRAPQGFRTASAWGARYEARTLAKHHDLVIIDTPPKMGIDGRPAIDVADLVVVPVSPSPVDLWATEPTLELAAQEGKPVLIVLNRAASRLRLTGEMRDTLEKLGYPCAQTIIGNRVMFAETMGKGEAIADRSASTPAAREIAALAAEVSAVMESL